MPNTNKLNYQFCPFCGLSLSIRIEEGHERKYCEHCKWTYYPSGDQAAFGVVVRNGKIALARRNREPYKGTWNFPAGFVDYGEDPKETIKREIKEELGLKILKVKFIKYFQTNQDHRSPQQTLFFFEVETEGEISNGDPDENSEVAWFDIANPPEFGWPTHKLVMRWLQMKFKKTKQSQKNG